MSERSTSLLIEDIVSSINNILEFTKGMSFDGYKDDLKTRHAVERNFEIIGEAASRVPATFKAEHPSIEWRIIKDFRNFIIHEYFGIDDQIVWETISRKRPSLLKQLKTL
jgi:uncharacterized protein with HEPN domain